GPTSSLGHVIHMHNFGGKWKLGFPPETPGILEKRPGLSGPLTDAYFDRCIHVYGTKNPEHTAALERTAERGAQGWPLWLWNFRQQVVPDKDVTEQMMKSAHLVLYGTPGDNAILERIKDRLPIRLEADGLILGPNHYSGTHLGTRF